MHSSKFRWTFSFQYRPTLPVGEQGLGEAEAVVIVSGGSGAHEFFVKVVVVVVVNCGDADGSGAGGKDNNARNLFNGDRNILVLVRC